ncbi:type 2 isopentenyl-diphosphate Delta-isomerase [Xanthobacter sp. V4C-4]|uniref:type 2 isopentenyl-diphosphate Delta-isomerase n=1 Tax=Xanthobacter cornucopiae TaxID=3119924 RepID=UPI0037271A5B
MASERDTAAPPVSPGADPAPPEGGETAGRRKSDHIAVVLAGRALSRCDPGFDAVRLTHCAAPELALDEVSLATTFLGRALRAPLLISAMTGGPALAERINIHLAEAAQELGLALGVGSQRIALERSGSGGLGPQLRRLAPDILLLANLGAAQFVRGYGLDEARRAVEMLGADALVIHLNPLQEAVQPGGDRDWRGALDAVAGVAAVLPVPVVVKEVGFGLSAAVARALVERGIAALDVAGAGGTNWALVEGARGEGRARAVAAAFAGWGIPTATAVRQVRAACPRVPLIASGGVRDGVDMAKAIRLGADLAGQAAAALPAALESTAAVVEHFSVLRDQLQVACFVCGARDLAALRRVPLLEEA